MNADLETRTFQLEFQMPIGIDELEAISRIQEFIASGRVVEHNRIKSMSVKEAESIRRTLLLRTREVK